VGDDDGRPPAAERILRERRRDRSNREQQDDREPHASGHLRAYFFASASRICRDLSARSVSSFSRSPAYRWGSRLSFISFSDSTRRSSAPRSSYNARSAGSVGSASAWPT